MQAKIVWTDNMHAHHPAIAQEYIMVSRKREKKRKKVLILLIVGQLQFIRVLHYWLKLH